MRQISFFRPSKFARTLAATLGIALILTMPEAASLRAADAFVSGTEDIPLMPGLAPIDDADVIFDTPQGRIVEAYAKGDMTRKSVLEFYARTLPQLGWSAAGTGAYRREGEVLRLELYQEKGRLTVRFYLSPS
ncbi:MAG TPA: hypothetical protein VEJ16_16360 [Alphaproteobacteria bacterium]|nr:hypothetical protein [Alphaproteobacteria bacterium]